MQYWLSLQIASVCVLGFTSLLCIIKWLGCWLDSIYLYTLSISLHWKSLRREIRGLNSWALPHLPWKSRRLSSLLLNIPGGTPNSISKSTGQRSRAAYALTCPSETGQNKGRSFFQWVLLPQCSSRDKSRLKDSHSIREWDFRIRENLQLGSCLVTLVLHANTARGILCGLRLICSLYRPSAFNLSFI